VEGLGRRMGFAGRGDIDHLKRHGAASEIATRARLLAPGNAEQRLVEARGLIEVADLDVETEQAWHVAFPGREARLLRSRFLLAGHVVLPFSIALNTWGFS